jgi:hypothetical protein
VGEPRPPQDPRGHELVVRGEERRRPVEDGDASRVELGVRQTIAIFTPSLKLPRQQRTRVVHHVDTTHPTST